MVKKGDGKGATPTIFGSASKPAAVKPREPTINRSRPAQSDDPKPGGPIGPGSILNNTFRIVRFIARGGMGEVYEGTNIVTDERVAIKLTPAGELSKREAQMMTRLASLHHPAIVQYRVAAIDPTYNAFSIVMEYIDGVSLSDFIGSAKLTDVQLLNFAIRLADGLHAAHEMHAIHRDISPDNILLPDGDLSLAKIIDFGVAKDTRPEKATIVGAGFAGKLGFSAPEQFGEHGGEVGAWTDVYSLGLVILAVAQGREVDMGATISEALARRKFVPDLSNAPLGLRRVLSHMLEPDPRRRLRSMAEVLDALKSTASSSPRIRRRFVSKRFHAILAVGFLLAGVMTGLVFASLHGLTTPARPGPPGLVAPSLTTYANADKMVLTAINSLPCSWLSRRDLTSSAAGYQLGFEGWAGNASEARSSLSSSASRAGLPVSDLNLSRVLPIPISLCPILDELKPFRGSDGAIKVARNTFAVEPHRPDKQGDSNYAEVAYSVSVPDAGRPFVVGSIDGSGQFEVIVPDRAEEAARFNPKSDEYDLRMTESEPGTDALVLLTGGNADQLRDGIQAIQKEEIGAGTNHVVRELEALVRRSGAQAAITFFQVTARPRRLA